MERTCTQKFKVQSFILSNNLWYKSEKYAHVTWKDHTIVLHILKKPKRGVSVYWSVKAF